MTPLTNMFTGPAGVALSALSLMVWVALFPDPLNAPLLIWAVIVFAKHHINTDYEAPSKGVLAMFFYGIAIVVVRG